MNDDDRRIHQTLVRSREAFAQSVNDFAAGGAGRQLYADLQAVIAEVEQKSTAHGVGRSDAKQGTQTINNGREELLAGMFAVREVAKVLNLEEKFPYPPRNNDEALMQTAGVYITNATPVKADALARGIEIVRKLTSLMKVKYANNPGKLAEWMAASHVERAPRRAKAAPPPTQPPQP